MIRLEMKNYSMILIEKQLKYRLYHQVKQIKTIEDQGEKQIKAIQDEGQVKTIKKYGYDAEDTPFISKQKEIFNELVDERRKKITDLDKKNV